MRCKQYIFAASAIVSSLLLSACTSPEVAYSIATDDDQKNLQDGEILFYLRTTNFLLAPTSMTSAQAVSASPTDVCKDKKLEAECFTSMGVTATEASEAPTPTNKQPPLISAKPGDWYWFSHTKLTAATFDNDNTNIKSVTVNFTDNTVQAITAVGTAVTTGAAFGPAGLVAGVVVGIGGQIISNNGNNMYLDQKIKSPALAKLFSDHPKIRPLSDLICKSDKITDSDINEPKTLSLALPVSVSFENALSTDNGIDGKGCWHLLPTQPSSPDNPPDQDKKKGAGWLYRLVLSDPEKGTMSPSAFLDSSNASTAEHQFPYNPCQNVEFDLVWWQTAQAGMPDQGASTLNFHVAKYDLKAANPALVKGAPLPKAGSILLGSICGAQVNNTTYTGSTIADYATALANLASIIQKAQNPTTK